MPIIYPEGSTVPKLSPRPPLNRVKVSVDGTATVTFGPGEGPFDVTLVYSPDGVYIETTSDVSVSVDRSSGYIGLDRSSSEKALRRLSNLAVAQHYTYPEPKKRKSYSSPYGNQQGRK